jgi:predicted nuclease of predicted toxin-antitoxin system
MRFVANENIPISSVRQIRAAGHEVLAVTESAPSITDADVLSWATQEAAIVLTFDRDYGELIYRHHAPAPAGIIYFRFQPITPDEPAVQLLDLLVSVETLEGMFTVVERSQVRQRPLPSKKVT